MLSGDDERRATVAAKCDVRQGPIHFSGTGTVAVPTLQVSSLASYKSIFQAQTQLQLFRASLQRFQCFLITSACLFIRLVLAQALPVILKYFRFLLTDVFFRF